MERNQFRFMFSFLLLYRQIKVRIQVFIKMLKVLQYLKISRTLQQEVDTIMSEASKRFLSESISWGHHCCPGNAQLGVPSEAPLSCPLKWYPLSICNHLLNCWVNRTWNMWWKVDEIKWQFWLRQNCSAMRSSVWL